MMAEIKPNNNFSELEILLHKLRKYLMKIPCTDKVKVIAFIVSNAFLI